METTRLGGWLDERLWSVDADLAIRVRGAIAPSALDGTVATAPGELAAASTRALRTLLARGCSTRASATDLLAVDALVTLACEALASAALPPHEVAQRAVTMMRAIAEVLPTPPEPA